MEIEVRGGAWMKKERVQNITMDKTEYSLIRLDSVYPGALGASMNTKSNALKEE